MPTQHRAQHLWPLLGVVSPTREGLLDGLLQLGRLVSVLSGLAILLELLPQTQLISGLYSLAYPCAGSVCRANASPCVWRSRWSMPNLPCAIRRVTGVLPSMLPCSPRQTERSISNCGCKPFRVVDVLVLAASAAVLVGVWR